MTRSIAALFVACALPLTAAGAQSLHQGEGLGSSSAPAYSVDSGSVSFWDGPRYWWNPFGYSRSGYGWYGGGYSGASQSSGAPAPRPTPPANAPPQFQKKY